MSLRSTTIAAPEGPHLDPPSGPRGVEVLGGRRARRRLPVYSGAQWLGVIVFGGVLASLVVVLALESSQAFAHSGLGFLFSGTWNPARNEFGAGILLVGTVVTTFVAMAMIIPVGLGAAVALIEWAPPWLASPASAAIDLMAAVPSIVVGLWGLAVLSPIFANHVEPFLGSLPGIGAIFSGPDYGPSILLASVVLAVMTLPTMITLSRSALASVPTAEREAALALGATPWQVVSKVVVPGARSGIAAGITLAIGRALGESISVALVIGNSPSIPHSLGVPGATLGSAIVNQFAEATPGLGTSSIIGLAVVLLVLTVLVNVGGQALMRRGHRGPLGAVA